MVVSFKTIYIPFRRGHGKKLTTFKFGKMFVLLFMTLHPPDPYCPSPPSWPVSPLSTLVARPVGAADASADAFHPHEGEASRLLPAQSAHKLHREEAHRDRADPRRYRRLLGRRPQRQCMFTPNARVYCMCDDTSLHDVLRYHCVNFVLLNLSIS